eukprot:5370388-Pyramimonas_sp.AAC.1
MKRCRQCEDDRARDREAMLRKQREEEEALPKKGCGRKRTLGPETRLGPRRRPGLFVASVHMRKTQNSAI